MGAVDRVRTSLTLQTLSASSPCHHTYLRWWIHPYLAKTASVKCFKLHNLHLILQLHPAVDSLELESSAGEHLCCGECIPTIPTAHPTSPGAF